MSYYTQPYQDKRRLCAYERKPGTGSFYDVVIPPLSEAEKAEIAGEIRYVTDADVRLAALAWTSPIGAAVKLQQAFPRLYTLLYPSLAPDVSKVELPSHDTNVKIRKRRGPER